MFRKICVNLFHRPVRAHNDAVGVEVVRLPVEYELITVLKSLCFVQERRVAERAVLWEPARADGQDPRRVGRAEFVCVLSWSVISRASELSFSISF